MEKRKMGRRLEGSDGGRIRGFISGTLNKSHFPDLWVIDRLETRGPDLKY